MSGHGYFGATNRLAEDSTDVQVRNEREDTWGEMTGTVKAFDPTRQTATIQPDMMKRLNGMPTSLPELLEVPVRFPRAGGFVITSPVRAGDKVALRPQMRSTEAFHTGGDYGVGDPRSASLSDYEAFLDGGEALTSPIPNFNAQNMEIRSADGAFKIEMSEGGKFKIAGAEGNVYTIIAAALRLLANAQTIVTKGSSLGLHTHDQLGAVNGLADQLDGMAL